MRSRRAARISKTMTFEPKPPMAPLVSVVIPVYNGAATIACALNSVFDQTFTDYEVIVCDDGSTDDTPTVLAGFADRIRVIRQSNRRFPAARNAAVAASRGDLIALIDHDDQWLPRHLEVSVAALQNDPGAALVYSDVTVVNEAGEESRAHRSDPTLRMRRRWTRCSRGSGQ